MRRTLNPGLVVAGLGAQADLRRRQAEVLRRENGADRPRNPELAARPRTEAISSLPRDGFLTSLSATR